MCKLIPRVLTLVSLFAAVSSLHAAPLRLRITTDSVTIAADGERNTYPLSALKPNDTIRVWDITSLQLISTVDSITVEKSAEYVPIVFELPDSALHLMIWFADSESRHQDKIAILRAYPAFGSTPPAGVGKFTYTSPDDPDLTRLRKAYQLAEVAGNGTEIERMINLMRWVHATVRHDGSSTNPSPREALHLLQVCADSGRGLNCRMMATILNEAFLAMGFRSRHLTCLPQDTADPDCHVVNMVWSDSLRKWVYLDPTNNAYFTDASGAMLGPEEIRAAMIAGDSLVVNADADYNGSPLNHGTYKGYMAKNLFRFSAPAESAYGYESREGEVTWVNLSPIGWYSDRINRADTSAGKNGTFIQYYTDNAAWFWER